MWNNITGIIKDIYGQGFLSDQHICQEKKGNVETTG